VPADPRWNPAISNELLYSTHQGIGAAPETHIVDVGSGKDTKLPFTATDATWTWDGKLVAYLVESATRPQTGTALRLYDRASAAERELLVQEGPLDTLVAIASVAY
jgi:hypothetical protein